MPIGHRIFRFLFLFANFPKLLAFSQLYLQGLPCLQLQVCPAAPNTARALKTGRKVVTVTERSWQDSGSAAKLVEKKD